MTDERTTAYLLNELPHNEAEQFEEQCFSQAEWPGVELEAAEEGLIQAYVKGELSPERRIRFEKNYLTTDARKERLLLARSFLQVVCPASQPTPAPAPTWKQRVIDFLKALVVSPQVPVLKFATLVVILGLIVALWWLSFRTTAPQTFAHLNLAISSDSRGGSSRIQRVTLPLAEDALRISLALPESTPQGVTYRVQWEDIRRPIGDLDIEKQDASSVSVIIPANKLSTGQYALKLFRKNPDGTEERVQGSYLFNVD